MLVRYSTSDKTGVRRKAVLYTKEEHGIQRSDIDSDAVRITDRLKSAGFSGYIVGGAVRDLLLGIRPKDFDVVTDATPRDIKKLFRNSRIIGKRFRLVHIFFGDKIIEVSTFRSRDVDNNTFGTIEEDVLRRDFRVNALYYCPREGTVIDYVGGYRDIRRRRMRANIPHRTIFAEDPVRMIRAVKYAATTGFKLPLLLRLRMWRSSALLGTISSSRITEELFKIIGSGASVEILRLARRFDLLRHILPRLHEYLGAREKPDTEKRFFERMKNLDERVKTFNDLKKGRMLSFLLQDYLTDRGLLPGTTPQGVERGTGDAVHTAFLEAKEFFRPLAPPNAEIEIAVRFLLDRKRKRKPSRRKRTTTGGKDAKPSEVAEPRTVTQDAGDA